MLFSITPTARRSPFSHTRPIAQSASYDKNERKDFLTSPSFIAISPALNLLNPTPPPFITVNLPSRAPDALLIKNSDPAISLFLVVNPPLQVPIPKSRSQNPSQAYPPASPSQRPPSRRHPLLPPLAHPLTRLPPHPHRSLPSTALTTASPSLPRIASPRHSHPPTSLALSASVPAPYDAHTA